MVYFFSIAKKYVDNAIERISKGHAKNVQGGDESVLEKLLKINPDYAFVMAMDMLLAGIDTVGQVEFPDLIIFRNNCECLDLYYCR